MRIAHINGVYEHASTGKMILDIIKECNKKGYESKVFYSEGRSERPEAFRYIADWERNIHALLSRVSGLQGYWSFMPTYRLLKKLEEFSPDVIHIHVIHGNSINLPIFFSWIKRKQLKVVITLHDCWWFTGRCVHPTVYQCEKYCHNCKECPANRDVCPSWFFDFASKMLNDKKKWLEQIEDLQVIAVSGWLKKQAEKSFLPKSCINQIYNWVDTTKFYPRDTENIRKLLKLENKKIVLGVASIWYDDKGISDFIWLSKNLPEEYQVVLVGRVPKNFELGNKILSIPSTNSTDELAEYYSLADVFVNASKAETFGLTTVEAMACGTPVVGYNTTATPELVVEETGSVIECFNRDYLLKKTMQFVKSKTIICNCRHRAEDNFSKAVSVSKYVKLYN